MEEDCPELASARVAHASKFCVRFDPFEVPFDDAKAAVSSRRNRALQPVFEELQPRLEILEHDVEDGRVCGEQSIPVFHQGGIVFFGALHGRQNLFAIVSAADGIETGGYVDCLKDEFIERDELRAHG